MLDQDTFQEKLNAFQFDEDKFKVLTEDGRIAMVMTPKNVKHPAGEMTTFRSIYETVLDLDWKLRISLQIASEHILKNSPQYKPFGEIDKRTKMAIYYLENALFRLTSFWDMLAQGYRILHDVKKNLKNTVIDIDHVNYKSFFDPSKTPHNNFESDADEIHQYISGNNWHKLINELRNQMTHKFSPNIPAMSNYTMNLPYPLHIEIEAILEDYIMARKFLMKMFDTAEERIIKQSAVRELLDDGTSLSTNLRLT